MTLVIAELTLQYHARQWVTVHGIQSVRCAGVQFAGLRHIDFDNCFRHCKIVSEVTLNQTHARVYQDVQLVLVTRRRVGLCSRHQVICSGAPTSN